MNTFRHLSAIDQAEIAIETSISARTWQTTLPSYRHLSRLFGLSCPTIAAAVARLAKRGLLISSGGRKSYTIAKQVGASTATRHPAKQKRQPHLLALFSQDGETIDYDNRRLLIEAIRHAQADGWICTLEGTNYLDSKTVQKRWDSLLHGHPTHLLAAPGTLCLAEWANHHGLKAAFIGGQTIDPAKGLSIGYRARDILGHCLEQLNRLGHRRILLPGWGYQPGVAAFNAKMLAEYSKGTTTAERLQQEGWVPFWPYTTPKEHRTQLTRSMAKLRPTAIITLQWRDYLVATQCAHAAGLRIPEDVSLVTLSPSAEVDWSLPIPAHYKTKDAVLIKCVNLWRQGKAINHEAMTRAVVTAWNAGETVGPARSTT